MKATIRIDEARIEVIRAMRRVKWVTARVNHNIKRTFIIRIHEQEN